MDSEDSAGAGHHREPSRGILEEVGSPGAAGELYRRLFEQNPDGLFAVDAGGSFTLVNPACEQICGYAAAELLQMTFMQLCAPDQLERTVAHFHSVVGRRSRSELETALIHKQGHRVELWITGESIETPGLGRQTYCTVRDVTQRKQADEALGRYRLLADHSRDIVLFMERNTGRLLEANAAALAAYGYSRDELLQMTIHDLRHEETSGTTAAQMASAAAGGILFETVHRRKDGTAFPVEVSSQGATVDRTAALISVIRDITGRKAAELVQKETERQQRLQAGLLDQVSDAVIAVDNRQRVTYLNAAAEQRYGIPASEIIGRPVMELLSWSWNHPGDPGKARRALARTGRWQGENVHRTRSGRSFPAESTISVIHDEGGRRNGFLATLRDITERRAAEEAALRSEAIYRRLAELDLFGVGFGDSAGGVAYINDEMLRMMGRTREEAEAGAVNWLEAIAPEHRPAEAEINRALPLLGKVVGYEREFLRPDGERTPFLGATAIVDADSDLRVSIALDLTHIRQTELALTQAKEVAEAASRAKDEFIAVLSHELRTPLTPALMAATILEAHPLLSAELRDDVRIIRRNVELEARLIDDMLDLTRIARGKLTLHSRIVDGREPLDYAIRTCHPEATDKGLRLEAVLPAEPVWIHGDPARLQQVFWNLLKNAIKFTPEKGEVTVTATASASGGLVVRIRDTGKGIEPQALETIFNAFEQGGGVTRRYGGLGLGLAICKGIVTMHKGSIRAASDGPERGATLWVELPPLPAGLHAPVRTPRVAGLPESPLSRSDPATAHGSRQAAAAEPASAGCRILLVEDHEASSAMIARLLRGFGHDVVIAGDVKTAEENFGTASIDLVISDLGLPDGTGHDLIRRLLARHWVPSIALTGYGMSSDVQRSVEAGFLEHLVKPVNARELQEAVERVLGRPRSGRS